MKILFLIKAQKGMVKAFRQLGHECCDDDFSLMIKEKGYNHFKQHILSIAKNFDWAVVPKGDFEPIPTVMTRDFYKGAVSFLNKLRKIIPTYHFMHDAILDRNFRDREKFIHYAQACSVRSTAYICNLNAYKKYGIEDVSQIYQGFETEWHYPLAEVKKKYDCIFIGKLFSYRQKVIDYLSMLGIKVKCLVGIEKEDVNMYYNKSKICINMVDGGYFSNRSLRIMGSGGFLLSSFNRDLQHTFKDGEEFVSWKSNRDLAQKIRYYLDNDKEREEIALAGNKRIQDFTWEKQVEKMIKVMNGFIVIDGCYGGSG